MKILDNVLGVLNKTVPAIFKDHDKKLSSKRVFKLGGGGALLYAGIEFLNKAVDTDNSNALYAGIACLAVGAFLAIGLSEKISQIQGVQLELKEKED